MSLELDKAIESLEGELQNIMLREVEIKKAINQLLFLNGSGPRFAENELESGRTKTKVEPRQFVGKDMVGAVKEIMRMHGRKPLSAQEVLEQLEMGDFDFPSDWKAKLKLKNISIFMGSRKDDFVVFDTKDGKVYALAEQYPERKKELDKAMKIRGAIQEVESLTDNSKKE